MSTVKDIVDSVVRGEKLAAERESEIADLRSKLAALQDAGQPAVLALCERIVRTFGRQVGLSAEHTVKLRGWSGVTALMLAREILSEDAQGAIEKVYEMMQDEGCSRSIAHSKVKGELASHIGVLTEIIRQAGK